MLQSGVDAAVTVADELPQAIRRRALFHGGFTCLYDPRHAKLGKLTEAEYFARDHIIVSYNGDLRGIVEDMFGHKGKVRRVRCSISSFANLGAILEGTAMLATVPSMVATHIRATRPALRTKELPLAIMGSEIELLWPSATDDDPPGRFVRDKIVAIASAFR
jgi:LysR family transcriptional activator of mexEF-oprN operon